jgi:hypothetical protein
VNEIILAPEGVEPIWPSDKQLASLGMGRYAPLPVSEFLKSKIDGRIEAWTETFAKRSDIFLNCDVNGNTDPRAWMRQGAEGYDKNSQPSAEARVPLQPFMETSLPTSGDKAKNSVRAYSSREILTNPNRAMSREEIMAQYASSDQAQTNETPKAPDAWGFDSPPGV